MMYISLTAWVGMFVRLIVRDHLCARRNPSPCCTSSSDRSSMHGAMHLIWSYAHHCSSNKHPLISICKGFTTQSRAQKRKANTTAPQL